MAYHPPVKEMAFILETLAPSDDPSMTLAVLDEAARLASDVWAPLNAAGDRLPPVLENGIVRTTPGFKEAYQAFVDGGWNAIVCRPEHGGMGMPWRLGMAASEMWQGANLALSLCPLLTQAAIEAIERHGTPEQRSTYLPHLISGHWAGTMNLTEPQAGTDLAAIRSVAKKDGGHYRLKGQKIFITWGDQDFTPNVVHLVLARVDGLPDGNDGLGLFIVPKFLVNADGTLGARNDVHVVSLEHKLGIHGSPTCVMSYGDSDGAIAYLVGEEGKGLRNMFTMMNNARLSVGVQGVGVMEAATQHALNYAKNRVQGMQRGKRVAIIEHPDVRRMIMTMRATADACRALCYYAGAMIDAGDMARVDLLTPLVKAYCTDSAVDMASLGVQVHGGMGFIEETGAAQFYRDARILPIYEGTNGVQSQDLVFRKVLRDDGAEAKKFIGEMKGFLPALKAQPGDDMASIHHALSAALDTVEESTQWILDNGKTEAEQIAAGAASYLRQFAMTAAGHLLARQAFAAQSRLMESGGDADFLTAKIVTTLFYAEALLPQVHGLSGSIIGGHRSLAGYRF